VRWDREAKPGVSNLLELLAALRGGTPAQLAESYENYGDLKADVADAVIETVRPMQARYRELSADPGAVLDVLKKGADRASDVAAQVFTRARRSIGLLPR
jgi:tryptophanyl-tRNA synthetase